MVVLLALVATVSFAGSVPPHRASDGKVFVAVASSADAVEAGLKACAVQDFATLGRLRDGHAYQFAIGPSDAGRESCVAEKLTGTGTVEPRERWVG